LLLVLNACSKKPDIKASISELEKAFPAAITAAPAVAVAPPAPLRETFDANAYVSAALSAVRANDYGAGVSALEQVQRLRDSKGSTVTASQLMALEQAKQAMIANLVARADRGDPKAKADLAAIEKTHSQ
jgi:hypothetical protein